MEILAIIVMIGLALTSSPKTKISPIVVKKDPPKNVDKYENRPYGSVKYLEDM